MTIKLICVASPRNVDNVSELGDKSTRGNIDRNWMLQYINSVDSNSVREQKKQKQNVTENFCERYLFLVTASYVK